MTNTILILAGPTASGKSALALDIAEQLNTRGKAPVIINADSQQVYQEIPILSAQPSTEEQARVPHKLYGVLSLAEECSVARWCDMAKAAIDTTLAEGQQPLLVGGTGMYIKTLIHGIAPIPDIDPEIRAQGRQMLEEMGNDAFHAELAKRDPVMAGRLDPGNSQRILRTWEVFEQTGISLAEWQEKPHETYYKPEQFRGVFLNPPREEIYARVNARFEQMIEDGVLEEVKAVDALELDPSETGMKAHGLPELRAHLAGDMPLEDAVAQAQQNTRHYVKRQITWFTHQLPELVEASTPEEALENLIK